MKRVLALTTMLMAVSGCQQYMPTQPEESVEQATVHENVVPVSQLMLNVRPSSLEHELSQLALQANLRLEFNAEPMMHKRSGPLTGSPVVIAQQLVQALPVRVYLQHDVLVVEQMWSVSSGRTLKKQMNLWDKQSEWDVVWETRKNMHIQANANFFGSFDDAVEQLFQSVRNDGSELEPEFYPNKTVVVR